MIKWYWLEVSARTHGTDALRSWSIARQWCAIVWHIFSLHDRIVCQRVRVWIHLLRNLESVSAASLRFVWAATWRGNTSSPLILRSSQRCIPAPGHPNHYSHIHSWTIQSRMMGFSVFPPHNSNARIFVEQLFTASHWLGDLVSIIIIIYHSRVRAYTV